MTGDAEEAQKGIALLATRLGMLSLNRAGLADRVANNMATLCAMLPPQPQVLYAGYVTEPMIGAAAFMEMASGTRSEGSLRALSNAIKSDGAGSLFSAGAAGELTEAAMLPFANDRVL